MYVRMLKAMYRLLRSALLFYLKLRGELEEFGFKMNEYDPCIANKMVNGKQMTSIAQRRNGADEAGVILSQEVW